MREAEATVVVTEWSEILTLDLHELAAQMSGTLFVDARNAFAVDAVVRAGLTYVGIGRPGVPAGIDK